ncbi:Polyketide cyclase / dehydrase and lipid transport [Actinopolyspora lacussalsi subsp. righensis]|uniref:Polyketide cyclase / dehydrase and lipid transport n=1 Tax=Actinopolyspora righensis TaxID=995060 RepID=A0A1I6XBA0_9ACTN|nr:SRPBCC family protein [Actinopolyspora righensis]SFT35466.1 Polyketide cyclase / dehydrase and lipid transport [Actinopolyspora righensis]
MVGRQVSATKTVATTPDRIFELLTDPTQHSLLDGSGTVRQAQQGGPQRLELGSKFGMDMKMGTSYKILNTVVEFEQDHLIAWRHFNGHRWRWRLRPVGERTEVTETFDWSTARIPLLISLSPFPRRNRAAIEKSLHRLGELFPG